MRCVNVGLMSVCVAILMVGMSVGVCRADTVALNISNPGFDVDDVSGAGWAEGATGWTAFGFIGTQVGSSGSLSPISSPNWLFTASNEHPGAGAGQLLRVGSDALRMNEGDTLALSFNQGHRLDYWPQGTQQFQVEIWRDGCGAQNGGTQAYLSSDLGNVSAGSWALRTVNYTAVASDVGRDMYVLLYNPGSIQVQLDNVSGTWTHTIPEPGTFTILFCGLLGLLAYAWRKRK
jgi:hypothetical protein